MDTMIHIENDKYIGKTEFSDKLLIDAIALAVADIAGVVCIGKDDKRKIKKAIRISKDDDGIRIKVVFSMEYGYSVADVSYRVQELVISIANSITNKKIIGVDVVVIGTKVKKNAKGAKQDGNDNKQE
jgi:uncharacterized alkaline shock family protein YloU